MSNLTVRLTSQNPILVPGAEMEVDLEWDLDHPAENLELRLVWNTSGKGDQDMKVAKTYHLASPGRTGSQRMSIVLPWGPYSFSGRLISLGWAFELVSLPDEESVREPFVLAPHGHEALLTPSGVAEGTV